VELLVNGTHKYTAQMVSTGRKRACQVDNVRPSSAHGKIKEEVPEPPPSRLPPGKNPAAHPGKLVPGAGRCYKRSRNVAGTPAAHSGALARSCGFPAVRLRRRNSAIAASRARQIRRPGDWRGDFRTAGRFAGCDGCEWTLQRLADIEIHYRGVATAAARPSAWPGNARNSSFSRQKLLGNGITSRFGRAPVSIGWGFSCLCASRRYSQLKGQSTLTSRSVPQQSVQISPRTPGQKRRGRRIRQMAQAISLV
jgi:hypothetical protein